MKDIHSTSSNTSEEIPEKKGDDWYQPIYHGEDYLNCTGNRINDLRMCLKFLSNARLLLNAPSPDYLPPDDLHPLTAEFDRLYDILEEEMFDWNGNTGVMSRERKKIVAAERKKAEEAQ
tara:strand:- start:253 stop:609 length:357 start_codon:yes stop_codon:yes gene_type:complete